MYSRRKDEFKLDKNYNPLNDSISSDDSGLDYSNPFTREAKTKKRIHFTNPLKNINCPKIKRNFYIYGVFVISIAMLYLLFKFVISVKHKNSFLELEVERLKNEIALLDGQKGELQILNSQISNNLSKVQQEKDFLTKKDKEVSETLQKMIQQKEKTESILEIERKNNEKLNQKILKLQDNINYQNSLKKGDDDFAQSFHSLFERRNENVQAKIAMIISEDDKVRSELIKARSDLLTTNLQVNQLNTELSVFKQENYLLRNDITALMKHFNNLIQVFREESHAQNYSNEMLKVEIQNLKSEVKLKETNLNLSTLRINSLETERSEGEKLLKENSQKMNILSSDYTKLKLQLLEKDTENQQLIEDNKSTKIQLATMENKVSELSSKVNVNNVNLFLYSTIIRSADEFSRLRLLINPKKAITFNLIYSSNYHADERKAFHDKVDKYDTTLVLIETVSGRRFGGFTRKDWEIISAIFSLFGIDFFKDDKDSFLFSMDTWKKYPITETKTAIYADKKHMFAFGNGDIIIKDKFKTKQGESFFPKSYGSTKTDKKFELTGEQKFLVKTLEVYNIQFLN